MNISGSVRAWSSSLKRDTTAVALALVDPRTPWSARLLGAAVVAYAVSPIDLVPDFIPVLGLLDDLLIVPIGLWLLLKLVPLDVMEDCRARAAETEIPSGWAGVALVVAAWSAAAILLAWVAAALAGWA